MSGANRARMSLADLACRLIFVGPFDVSATILMRESGRAVLVLSTRLTGDPKSSRSSSSSESSDSDDTMIPPLTFVAWSVAVTRRLLSPEPPSWSCARRLWPFARASAFFFSAGLFHAGAARSLMNFSSSAAVFVSARYCHLRHRILCVSAAPSLAPFKTLAIPSDTESESECRGVASFLFGVDEPLETQELKDCCLALIFGRVSVWRCSLATLRWVSNAREMVTFCCLRQSGSERLPASTP